MQLLFCWALCVFLPVINVDLNAVFIFNWSVWLLKKRDWKQEFDASSYKCQTDC